MKRDEPAPRVLLVGMMGAGKTTVGRLLAERLGWAYLDSDAQVQAATGASVPELFTSRGEAGFRRVESEVLHQALAGSGPVVVSVAGGAVLDPANRTLLKASGPVIWLRAQPETLVKRVGDGHGRPLLGSDPTSALERLDRVRRPLYGEVADHVLDVDQLSPSEIVDRLLITLGAIP